MFNRLIFFLAMSAFSALAADSAVPIATVLKVVIVARDDADSRIAATREALVFWNEALAELKLPVRLEEARISNETALIATLQRYAHGMDLLNQRLGRWVAPPAALDDVPEKVLIFLSEETLMSFELDVREHHFIAIRTAGEEPLSKPNVARNVIAHELGHALGLDHNADPKSLMCGRPSKCGPERYESEQLKFFPLTERDRTVLQHRFKKE